MSRIQILESDTAEKIAAGEVVERPASVVKELVENSIDSGATSIFVDLEDGGHSLIRITDNGCGMSAEDLPIAVRRFATSKIRSFDDVYSLSSLGFRGEALPSIAAVSRLSITSRMEGDEFAHRIKIEGSEILGLSEAAGDKGTCVEVADLFYNTPARKKFQKTPANEVSHIVRFLSQMAVMRRDIHFRLRNNGRVVFNYPDSMTKNDCLGKIWALGVDERLFSFHEKCDSGEVRGVLCSPDVTRSTRNEIMVSVNGRIVKNTLLIQAVIEGYAPFLPQRKYPLSFIEIEVPPDRIDVNVHPAKTEIHFVDQQKIFGFLRSAVSMCVRKFRDPEFESIRESSSGLKYNIETGEILQDRPSMTPTAFLAPKYTAEKPGKKRVSSFLNNLLKPSSEDFDVLLSTDGAKTEKDSAARGAGQVSEPDCYVIGAMKNDDSDSRSLKTKEIATTEAPVPDCSKEVSPASFTLEASSGMTAPKPPEEVRIKVAEEFEFEPLRQIFDTYIAAVFNGEFIMIDQHAAHEKIMYEQLKNKGDGGAGQMLLIPEIIELPPAKAVVMSKYLEHFAEMGVDVSDFGRNSFKVTSIPFFLKPEKTGEFIVDTIDAIIEETSGGEMIPIEKLRDMAACKSAIKANHRLQRNEIISLFKVLMTLDEPFFCPHGRPVIHKFTKYELEKLFKRT